MTIRLTLSKDSTVKTHKIQQILPQLIRLIEKQKPPRIFVDVLSGVPFPDTGAPTLKILLPTTPTLKTREYLPVTIEIDCLKNGLMWTPIQVAQPHDSTEYQVLCIIHSSIFEEITIPFQWINEIHRLQYTILPSYNNFRSPKQRKWSISKTKSELKIRRPFPDENESHLKEIPTKQSPKQFCIFTGPPRNIVEFLTILNRKDNVYLRYQNTGQNHYFATTKQPVFNGITVEYGDDKLFFFRIRILSNLQLRLIHKVLLQYQENDWTPLFGNELFLLKDPIPQNLHSILRRVVE